MNDERRLERLYADVLADTVPTRTPAHLRSAVMTETATVRQRPRWLALSRETPMRSNGTITVGSPTIRVAAVLAAVLLLAAITVATGVAASRLLAAEGDIIVAPDGSGTVTTITEAVAMADDGDTILVRPGTYDESITITEDITIRGDGDRDDIVVTLSIELAANAQVHGPDLPYAFRLEGSDATIEHLTVRGDSSRIEIIGGSPTLTGLLLDDIGRVYGSDPGRPSVPSGLQMTDGSTATITANDFVAATMTIFSGSSPQVVDNVFDEGAIFTDGLGTDPLIEDNDIARTGGFHAVTAFGGAKPVIRDNRISSEQAAILARDQGFPSGDTGTHPTIVGNTIEDSATGIEIVAGAHADIEDNRILGNDVGIQLLGDARVDGNTVRGGRTGISVLSDAADGSAPTLSDNSVEGAEGVGIGIVIGRRASPTLTGNRACGNGTDLRIADGATPTLEDNEFCVVREPSAG